MRRPWKRVNIVMNLRSSLSQAAASSWSKNVVGSLCVLPSGPA